MLLVVCTVCVGDSDVLFGANTVQQMFDNNGPLGTGRH